MPRRLASRDPVFNQDVSFYVFNLPVYSLVQSLLSMMTVVIAIAVVIIYALALGKFRLTPGVKAHLSALGAIFLLLFAWNYQLSIYNMVYSHAVSSIGASYHRCTLPVAGLQHPDLDLTILAAIILLANVFLRATKALAITGGVWLVVTILLAQVFPQAMQNFEVKPNELAKGDALHREQHQADTHGLWPGHHSGGTLPRGRARPARPTSPQRRHGGEHPPVGLSPAARYLRPTAEHPPIL